MAHDKVFKVNVLAGWTPDKKQVGSIFVESIRGSEVISFQYDKEWLLSNPNLLFDADVSPVMVRLYPSGGKKCFGFIGDASPDRWGQMLINRFDKENHKSGEPLRTLLDSDYLLRVYDRGRQGGFQFVSDDGYIYSSDKDQMIPPITELRKLEDVVRKVEAGSNDQPKWLRELVAPGSSLGGARPKANVVDVDGSMWIAKFPSKTDEYNVGAWEMVCHELMRLCGISVPAARLVNLSSFGSTYLTKRFDRYLDTDGTETRRHFASAMNLLGRTDNDDVISSYLDIVGLAEKQCSVHIDAALNELWRRLVFNVCVTNTDDHLRNHGFVLSDANNWELSPAYDVNPNIDKIEHSLMLDFDSTENSLYNVFQVRELFRITEQQARDSIKYIQQTVSDNWQAFAAKYGVKNEIKLFARCFSEADVVKDKSNMIF